MVNSKAWHVQFESGSIQQACNGNVPLPVCTSMIAIRCCQQAIRALEPNIAGRPGAAGAAGLRGVQCQRALLRRPGAAVAVLRGQVHGPRHRLWTHQNW